ncbi:DNA topoisomerase I [Blattabacterium sp. (Blattella germanica) str. Bge]|uniref:type I DNA topoisomerase n=1 Tax=Blattabacterium sp. (Blattella germanica) TaxID=624186 RepID=UPI0001BB6176|nr:type I DNA topoisomerase [Blattabacterium sp. (Blattella germanica)]ACY40320.1 DNA topoisomerase I [Blattabacterium sp. (Blattella germanica) str. Bge]
MKENLVIVESPTKAYTIQTFLGKDYYVVSSYGHIIDLPEKEIGVEIKDNFKPNYVILSKKKKIVQNLKILIKNHKIIWLASDEDREGEAIAYQIYKTFNIPDRKYRRIVFHEITKKAIFNAIKNPRSINYDLVYAQQARRILDRLVGFQLSPVLWKKVKRGLSAGRVQSAAVKLIVEQENKIQKFIPSPTYQVYGVFSNEQKMIFNAKLDKKIEDKKKMKNILSLCINSSFLVKKIVIKHEKKNPPPPFTTSSLQQEACKKLNYSISKTMFLAQKLYEKGFITYMRTDSTSLSKDILSEIKDYILSLYGKKYLSTKEFSKGQKFSQEAHESIHPTVINHIDNNYLNFLDIYQKRLYQLIWERTIMGQMIDSVIEKKDFYIQSSHFDDFFIWTKRTVLLDGFMKIVNQDENKKEKLSVLEMKQGTHLQRKEIIAKQIIPSRIHRYNEASLVNNLEKLGIGRPSTYVPIISAIQKRNYVSIQKIIKKTETRKNFLLKGNSIIEKNEQITEIEKNKFIPTEIGVLITNFLKKNFAEIVDYNFTANLEKNFDDIAKGKQSWIKILQNFYDEFHKKIQYVEEYVDKIHKERFLGIDPKSNKKIFSKIARFGPIVQMGEFKDKEKPKFSPLLNSQTINTISFTEALKILELPKSLGFFEEEEVLLKINKYNIYIKHKKKYIPIEEKIFFDSFNLGLEQAIKIIIENRKIN